MLNHNTNDSYPSEEQKGENEPAWRIRTGTKGNAIETGQSFGPAMNEMRGAEHAELQYDRIVIPDEDQLEEEKKHPIRQAAVAPVAAERIVNQDPDQPLIRPSMLEFLNPELPVVLE